MVRGARAPTSLSTEVYDRIQTKGEGTNYLELTQQTSTCQVCQKEMKKGSLQHHMEQVYKMEPAQYMCQEVRSSAILNVDTQKGKHNICPIPGYTDRSKDKFGMY